MINDKKNANDNTTIETPTYGANMSSQYEANKYLYEVGLQNVFNDYQKNVATLTQQEQQQLQNAYTIREMSKKYLGEYASNLGVGDVSGNLLDIYSQYQQQTSEISKHYDELELNLDKEYQKQHQEIFANILQNEYAEQVAQLDQEANDVLYEIQNGDYTLTESVEYLNEQYSSGRITEEHYRSIQTMIYARNYEIIEQNLDEGYYGFTTNENGERVPITNAKDYIESIKGSISPQQYQELINRVEYGEQTDVDVFEIHNPGYEGNENPYYNPDYDPSSYIVGENVGKDSDVYIFGGQEHVQILDDVDSEKEDDAAYDISSEDLWEIFETKNGHTNAVNGDILPERGTYYVFKDGKWYRLVTTNTEMRNANIQSDFEANGKNWTASGDNNLTGFNYKAGTNTLIYNNVKYTENTSTKFNPNASDLTAEQKAIAELFKTTHGNKKDCVVFYKGNFYHRRLSGKIVRLDAKEKV